MFFATKIEKFNYFCTINPEIVAKSSLYISFLSLLSTLFMACSFDSVPQGALRLGKTRVEVNDKSVDKAKYEAYIKQKLSADLLALKNPTLLQDTLDSVTQNTAPGKQKPKSSKRRRAVLLYDEGKAKDLAKELQLLAWNDGYLKANVSMSERRNADKMDLLYQVTPSVRYTVGSYKMNIQDDSIKALLRRSRVYEPRIKPLEPFSTETLEAERRQITDLLGNRGYLHFNKEYIGFTADSTGKGNQVDVVLHLMKYRYAALDSVAMHPRYRIGQVTYEPNTQGKYAISPKLVFEKSFLVPGNYYSATALQRTYNALGALPAVRYTNITTEEEADSSVVDFHIRLSTNKQRSISIQPEGTNTAGNLGAALSLTYENNNVFHSAELLSLKIRGAYEGITGLEGYQNKDYKEYNVEGRLLFPRFIAPFMSKRLRRRSAATSELLVSYNMQNRPEFHRRVFSSTWRYRWQNNTRRGGNKAYKLDLLDLSYISMPWISSTFKHDYLDSVSNRNAILRYNYEDLLIMRCGFGISYSKNRNAWKFNVETAGNLLKGLSSMGMCKKNGQGQHEVFNIAFAQYVRADLDYTHQKPLSPRSQLAMHLGFGIAYPYGNSRVLPFEKRYFSGGANSVRGWSVRELGPGKYRGKDGAIDFINQTGDLKLDMNLEYRAFLFWKIYGAAFLDAGNIWTLRKYADQEGGEFRFQDFYKQIAVAYGAGVRLNFDYFILRLDLGIRAINPAYEDQREHYCVFHPNIGRDFTVHFSVGLPF